jgi:hypothetical protein
VADGRATDERTRAFQCPVSPPAGRQHFRQLLAPAQRPSSNFGKFSAMSVAKMGWPLPAQTGVGPTDLG